MAKISSRAKTSDAGRFLFCMFAIALASAGPALAASGEAGASSPLASRYQPGSIQSGERAAQALAEVERERAGIAARFVADERACMDRFFANTCVEDARERQRHALAEVRTIEVEANALLRRLRVEERDRALAEKRIGPEGKEAERLKEAGPPAESSGQQGAAAAPATAISDRQARHEARLAQIEEKERAEAQQRADRAAAYEKRVLKAQERQRASEARTMKEAK
jgi:colicin import membrane protein